MSEFLNLQYLHNTLGEFVQLIMRSTEDCEVDPVRIVNCSSPHNCIAVTRTSSAGGGNNHSSGYFSSPANSSAAESVSSSNWLDQEMAVHRRALIKLVEFVWHKIWSSHMHFPR